MSVGREPARRDGLRMQRREMGRRCSCSRGRGSRAQRVTQESSFVREEGPHPFTKRTGKAGAAWGVGDV